MSLDAREVERKGKDLTKAATQNDPSSVLLSLLEDLRKGVEASEKLLRTTKIGHIVNKLKTHKDPAVAKASAEIVSKWRTDIKRQAGGGGAGVSSGASTPVPKANGTASPAPSPAVKEEKRKFTVAPEKRNAAADKVDTGVTGNRMRDNCVKMMYDGLAFMSEESPDAILTVARNIELAAFEKYQPETSEPYKTKVRSLYQNLKNKSNPTLRSRVQAGDISPAKFVTMSHDEMRSKEQKAEDEALMKENMSKAMVAQEEKSITNQLRCGKCGQRKVSYTQAQTRSADEPMTTFCECMNCGNRWKFS